jgi:trk system potassium uptake protein TrkH
LWRSFTHWIGGMGVLALLYALLPYLEGYAPLLVVTEAPGPVKGKLASKSNISARILYAIYFAITAALFILLCAGGMSVFDSAIHTFGTVGTGGFSNQALSMSTYANPYFEIVITVFMLICSVNFNLYYLLILKRVRDVLKSDEVRWLLAIFAVSTALILISIYPQYGRIGTSLRLAAFQSGTAMSTTGYFTEDFSKWPILAQTVMFMLMIVGGSSGSTAGGFKVARIMLLFKAMKRGLKKALFPNLVEVVRLESKTVDEVSVQGAQTYLSVYLLIILGSVFALSFDRYNFETNFLTVISSVNNIGLCWGEIGATGNLAGFSALSKFVLMADMLLGRLEIFPLVLAFYVGAKRKSAHSR